MDSRRCFREFLRYTSLNVMVMIGLSCYILADTFFVSKGLGAKGLAALNLAIPVYNFINGSGLMIGMGSGIRYSILKSQKQEKRADQVFTHGLILTACLAAVFFLLGLFASEQIAAMLGADETVFQMSRIYLQVILLFSPMFMMNNLLLCFVRNDGAPQRSMTAMIVGSLSNVVLDYIFIFPLEMGIFGAVLATGFAPLISILILSPYFIRKKNQFHPVRCSLRLKILGQIVSGGLPSLITEVSSGIVIIVFNLLILRLAGNTGVAAYGVIANLSLVVIAIYTGIAQGIQPLLSRNYGAGRKREVESVFYYAAAAAVLISAVVYAVVFWGADPIALVFNSEKNETLQSIAAGGLRIYFTGCVFAGLNIILSVYFTSTEFALPAHIISVLRGFVVIIPAACILAQIAGMTGVWCAFPATEVVVWVLGGVVDGVAKKKDGTEKYVRKG